MEIDYLAQDHLKAVSEKEMKLVLMAEKDIAEERLSNYNSHSEILGR